MNPSSLNRRGFVMGGASLTLGGCDRFAKSKEGRESFNTAETLSYKVQRFLMGADRLAPEFTEAEITKLRPNGSIDPKEPAYKRLVRDKFASWKLEVGGLVESPRTFNLSELRALPARIQITRHDCVEGWSAISKWKGVPLATILAEVKPKADARFVIFHCIDRLGADETVGKADSDDDDSQSSNGKQTAQLSTQKQGPNYYESIDLNDAHHPQTILAYEMNDAVLPVAHGAPLRLRLERQLGYKMAKYIMRIELADSFDSFGLGKGGYWEDLGYDWYAGV